MWFSRRPARAATQLAVDLGVLLWCLAWGYAGRRVFELVASLAKPVRTLAEAGTGYDTTMRDTSARLADVPLVGATLQDGFAALAGPGTDVADAGTRMVGTIERLGLVLGVLVALGPILLAVVSWIVARVAFARRAAAVRAIAVAGDVDLLALRALARQPLRRLATVGGDPTDGWRRADPAVLSALAALELRDVGTDVLRRPVSEAPATPRGASSVRDDDRRA